MPPQPQIHTSTRARAHTYADTHLWRRPGQRQLHKRALAPQHHVSGVPVWGWHAQIEPRLVVGSGQALRHGRLGWRGRRGGRLHHAHHLDVIVVDGEPLQGDEQSACFTRGKFVVVWFGPVEGCAWKGAHAHHLDVIISGQPLHASALLRKLQ